MSPRQTSTEAMAALLPQNMEDAIRALPQAERDAYEAAKQSVIDARRSAVRNEGQEWVG